MTTVPWIDSNSAINFYLHLNKQIKWQETYVQNGNTHKTSNHKSVVSVSGSGAQDESSQQTKADKKM